MSGLHRSRKSRPTPGNSPGRNYGLLHILALLAVVTLAASCSSPRGSYRLPQSAEDLQAMGYIGEGYAAEDADAEGVVEHAIVNDEAFADMYFEHFGVNPTIDTEEEPFSTFAVDVDTASYSLTRSYLDRGHLPPEEAVRVEEFINAFDYEYAEHERDTFDIVAEAFPSTNRKGYHVLHVGLKGTEVRAQDRKRANLVFVIDVSGSMANDNRLGLVKRSLRMLVDQMNAEDSIGLVVYGSRAHTILDPISAHHREEILDAIDRLEPEGSTNAQAGIKLGYQMAARGFREGEINRVILCSDGVANVGLRPEADGILAANRESQATGKGIYLISTVGFGMGNYNDVMMEKLANHRRRQLLLRGQ